MAHRTSSQRMGDAVARALGHWKTRNREETVEALALPTAPPTPSWTIAISRQAGTDGPGVAQALGQKLGWPVYDRELIEKIAEESGLRQQLVESIDERRVGAFREMWEAFTSKPGICEVAYVRHLTGVLSSLAAHGDCVIVGRGAAQYLPAATTLRVRLVGPLEERTKAMAERFGLTPEVATKRVREIDQERAIFIKNNFKKDPDDPALYDLILNTGRVDAATCSDLIALALERVKAPSTPVAAGT